MMLHEKTKTFLKVKKKSPRTNITVRATKNKTNIRKLIAFSIQEHSHSAPVDRDY